MNVLRESEARFLERYAVRIDIDLLRQSSAASHSERFFSANMIADSNQKGGVVCMQGRFVSAFVAVHTTVYVWR